MTSASPVPFKVEIAEAALQDLQRRLVRTRFDAEDRAADWEAGTSPAYLRQLVEYWRSGFDWRGREAEINRFAHFQASVRGQRVHFIHERGQGPRPLPLVLTHGYPDSFLRFMKLIPMLTDPAAHDGDVDDAFDVVVPSLPGYGFSEPPREAGLTFHIADLWHDLMTHALGYERYGAHGGDWGSTVTEHLARSHGDAVIGVHLTDVPFWHAFQKPSDPTPAEEAFLAAQEEWQQREGAYAMIQGTRPRTLADALNDSPAGLAAWMVQHFQRWSDCGGDVETRFTRDELLTHVTTYWATGSIGTAFLPYYDLTHAGALRWMIEKAKEWAGSSRVPAGFALFPRDISTPPREWAERFFDVRRWTPMPRGGHFAAHEEPKLLVDELRAFFRPLRSADPVH
jgi:pimeloyl-ACP methyl ester carboxylesterase